MRHYKLQVAHLKTGEAEIEVPINSFSGDKLEIAFNPVYIMDALKVIEADDIAIELKRGDKPGLIRSGNSFRLHHYAC